MARPANYPRPVLDESVVKRVLAEAAGKEADLAEIFAERRRNKSFRLDDSRIEDVASGSEAGAGIRVQIGRAHV